MRDISKNLKDARIESGMTQEELAQKLFVTRQTVSSYEIGRTKPDVEMLTKIAEVLQTDINTLIYGKPLAQNKRTMQIKTIVSTGILVLLLAISIFVSNCMENVDTFGIKANCAYWLHMAILPSICFVAGWTILQVLGMFLNLKKPEKKYTWIHIFVITVILAYAILVTPYLLGEAFRVQLPDSWNDLAYIVTGTHAKYNTAKIYLSVFQILGCLTWFFPWAKK